MGFKVFLHNFIYRDAVLGILGIFFDLNFYILGNEAFNPRQHQLQGHAGAQLYSSPSRWSVASKRNLVEVTH